MKEQSNFLNPAGSNLPSPPQRCRGEKADDSDINAANTFQAGQYQSGCKWRWLAFWCQEGKIDAAEYTLRGDDQKSGSPTTGMVYISLITV
ncbi:hypothetical protein [[Phormidium] sp. ETS-05]|uniref:hypothetical protein n=1 Tax=[Phormidium] sp. ETS-05 TaxID=222819 RepID=UPI0018EEE050|nr:hypothetical protein [[Phormidium] sp. ETS-05]